MEVIKVKISDLVFDPNNARKHNPKNIDAIKGSLTKFGQQKPIVIDSKNVVIAGNGTLSAAKELGWKDITAVVTTLDDFNKMAFALADNRTSELAEWDIGNLNQQLAQLDLGDFDLKGIGFDDFNFQNDDVPIYPEIVDNPKLENEIIILCNDYDERIEAIEYLGSKKINWCDLKRRIKQ